MDEGIQSRLGMPGARIICQSKPIALSLFSCLKIGS